MNDQIDRLSTIEDHNDLDESTPLARWIEGMTYLFKTHFNVEIEAALGQFELFSIQVEGYWPVLCPEGLRVSQGLQLCATQFPIQIIATRHPDRNVDDFGTGEPSLALCTQPGPGDAILYNEDADILERLLFEAIHHHVFKVSHEKAQIACPKSACEGHIPVVGRNHKGTFVFQTIPAVGYWVDRPVHRLGRIAIPFRQ